jgi:hypothetical protein
VRSTSDISFLEMSTLILKISVSCKGFTPSREVSSPLRRG